MRSLFFIFSLMFSAVVLSAGSGTGDQIVEAIQITSYDNLEIRLADQSHKSSCVTSGQENKIYIPAKDNNFDHFLSIALAAQISQKHVYIWIENGNCVTQGATSYPRASTILLRDY